LSGTKRIRPSSTAAMAGSARGCDPHVPLIGQIGLDHGAGAVAARLLEPMLLHPGEQAERLQVGDDQLAGLVAVETDVGLGQQRALLGLIGADRRIRGEDVDQAAVGLLGDRRLVAMPQPDLMVVEVVRGRDLDAAGPELRVGVLVGDDGMRRPVRGSSTNSPIRCL
jgi:hypothetical protein